jgi:hypothetical protein
MGGLPGTGGDLGLRIIKPPAEKPVKASLWDIIKLGLPTKGIADEVYRWRIANLPFLMRGFKTVAIARTMGLPHFHGTLYLDSFKLDGRTIEYGLVGFRLVTTVGVNYLADVWQGTVELEDMKYHALGTGSTAEAVGDTALVTELTTEYTGNVRATGSLTEGGSANVFRTVGTNTLDGTPGAALREHGILNQAATGGGVLWDRTVYAAITLVSGEALQSTYDATFSAGG